MNVAVYHIPYGDIMIFEEQHAVTRIEVSREGFETTGQKESELTRAAYLQIMEYLEGKRQEFTLPILLKGTDFQKKVWQALMDIPYGETRSYAEIARTVGNEKACRAVGMANNKNPLPLIIPCHRVIGKHGSLVGYAFGLDMKQGLLELEKAGVMTR